MIPFVDVSRHQGAIDFQVIAASGIAGVIIRAGNGQSIDPQFKTNVAGARAAGLEFGSYWFANPKAALGGAGQGQLLADAHLSSGSTLPPMWDAESYVNEAGPNAVLSGAPAAAWLATMVHTVDDGVGRASIGYTGASYWNAAMTPSMIDRTLGRFTAAWSADVDFLHGHDFILARYPGQRRSPPLFGPIVDVLPRGVAPLGWEAVAMATGKEPPSLRGRARGWDAWQWSAGGNAQGAVYAVQSSDLDLNIAYADVWARWATVAAPQPQPQPQPQPPAKDDDMPKYFVVTGAKATFIGSNALVRWTGPGDDKIGHGIQAQIDAGNLIVEALTGGPMAFAATILDGPLPTGDTDYTWTGDEFSNTAQIQAAPPADDSVAKAIVALNESVARLGQRQADAGRHLDEAGASLTGQ